MGSLFYRKMKFGLQNCIIDQTNQELISGIRDGLKLMKRRRNYYFFIPIL